MTSGAVVVVSGLPASGKTTLSERLATELGMVLICRDHLRRPFMGAWTALPPDERGPLIGGAIDQLVNDVLGAVLASSTGAVVDGNFNLAHQSDRLRDFAIAHALPCYEVCLWGDVDVLRQRFIDRDDPPITSDIASHLEEALTRPRRPVLGPPCPTTELDSTHLSEIDAAFPALIEDIRLRLRR